MDGWIDGSVPGSASRLNASRCDVLTRDVHLYPLFHDIVTSFHASLTNADAADAATDDEYDDAYDDKRGR